MLHCCSVLAHMAWGSVCLVLQAPARRQESLTLSLPGEMWASARNLHVTRTSYPTTPRLPVGTGRRWYVARRLGSDPHSLTALTAHVVLPCRLGPAPHGRGRTPGRWRGTGAQRVLPCPGCHRCWLHRLRRYNPRRRGGPAGTTPEWPLRWEWGAGVGWRQTGLQRLSKQLHQSARGCAGTGGCVEAGGVRTPGGSLGMSPKGYSQRSSCEPFTATQVQRAPTPFPPPGAEGGGLGRGRGAALSDGRGGLPVRSFARRPHLFGKGGPPAGLPCGS